MTTREKCFASLLLVLGMGCQSTDPAATASASGDAGPVAGSGAGDAHAPAETPTPGTRHLTAGGPPTAPGTESAALAKLEENLQSIEAIPVPVKK